MLLRQCYTVAQADYVAQGDLKLKHPALAFQVLESQGCTTLFSIKIWYLQSINFGNKQSEKYNDTLNIIFFPSIKIQTTGNGELAH